MIAIYPIVEGHGEVHAVPVLFRRIAFEICRRYDVQVLRPHRVPRGRMVAQDAIELHHAGYIALIRIKARHARLARLPSHDHRETGAWPRAG